MPVVFRNFLRDSEVLVRWSQSIRKRGATKTLTDEPPLRAELFSVHQLEQHAHNLAGKHQLATRRGRDRLITRLNENERVLTQTYERLAEAVAKQYQITPAAEWLLDNFYVVDEQIRTARRHLPRAYSQELPQLKNGPATGLPRVYGIAMELIAHADGGIDAMSLSAFVSSYQLVTPLKLGELWAIPIMLRLGLIDNLRRVAVRLAAALSERDAATEWSQRMVAMVEKSPSDLILVLADLARADPPLTSAFIAELTRHLHGQSPHFAFAQSWLEHRLSERGTSIAQLVQSESQLQAADQISIGNSITSLRVLGSTDWRDFVETQSVVDQTLRMEPLGVYGGMSVSTRDLYRHAVEEIGKHGRLSEDDVARETIRLAAAAFANGGELKSRHVGYYLIGKGRAAIERVAKVRPPVRAQVGRAVRRFPVFFYLGGVTLFTMSILSALSYSTGSQAMHPWVLPLFSVPVLLCVLQLVISTMNWLVTILIHPRPLPRMDFRKGIPAEHCTMVVIPTMLSNPTAIQEVLERIELHYVANRDEELHFALLTDLRDASTEVTPEDALLIQLAKDGVAALNEKYAAIRPSVFYLFHRPRVWNANDSVWMGYERKRGKLNAFTAFLRGGAQDDFSEIVGNVSALSETRYVICVDTDTQLSRDAARELIGAMAHPLNRPIIDPKRRRVVDGYGILQPRVSVSLPSASRSWFARLFASDSGLDPYTRVTSDVYQDLFGEGSFVGKGIYDVDAFNQTCADFPENTILSHDLLEGAYARSGLLSDVELYEDFPARYGVDARRRHRWIRGDWQIAKWILPRVPRRDGKYAANPLSALSHWKIFDNLRRSLVPPAMLALLLFGWLSSWSTVAAGATLLVVAVIATPHFLSALSDMGRKPADLSWGVHLRAFRPATAIRAGQVLYTLVFLPYEAFLSLDAILRTVWRVMWSRKRLLAWTTSSDAEQQSRSDLAGIFATMRSVMVGTAAIISLILLTRAENLSTSLPLLTLWLISPVAAWWLSRTIQSPAPRISAKQRTMLHKLARKTWRYFEVYVSSEENWLPPDNFQEQPGPCIASRTSPTNIGMALLANLAAYDFGYCSVAQLLARTQHTLGTMSTLERFNGHFCNWYDTRTLKPLSPVYVSTVDSGNLAMNLLVLRQGLLEQIDAKIYAPNATEGLRDTAEVLCDAIRNAIVESRSTGAPSKLRDMLRQAETICAELGSSPRSVFDTAEFLNRLDVLATNMTDSLWACEETDWWTRTLLRNLTEHREEIAFMAPWSSHSIARYRLTRHGPDCGDTLDALLARLECCPTLRETSEFSVTLLPAIDSLLADTHAARSVSMDDKLDDWNWLVSIRAAVELASGRAKTRMQEIEEIANRCLEFADMDFLFLYDDSRDLLSIGYNISDHRLDSGYYDLLASEARAASYFAVAQGQLDQEHWFALRRMLTTAAGIPALLSWNGSMFEYLMPMLVMPTFENTLLDRTCRAIVKRQIDYGKQRKIPWGISESGYNTLDVQLNYQYRGFGVPGLGLKRGLVDDLVVAPYATVLALLVDPESSCRNLERLTADGRQGPYGFYEAIDYTPSRLPRGSGGVTIRSFMAHHEGMSLLALVYVLLDRPMQRRFRAHPAFRANELLLQESIPRTTAPVFPHAVEASTSNAATARPEDPMRIILDPSAATPEVHLLSNGRYHVMVNSAGSGFSRWRDIALTRWREDPTLDSWGTFCYIRDLDSGKFWSSGYQPCPKPTTSYEAIFAQAKAEYRRRDDYIETHTEISVSPEDDIELRRITFTNRSNRPRTIEVTTYAEVVLAPEGHDLSHPAFSNLFVQTELDVTRQAILCTRRPRHVEELPPWMFHLMTVQGESVGETTFETDRMAFIGRGRTVSAPAAMERDSQLTGSQGSVLDPIVSIRRTLVLPANASARVDLIFGAAETRAEAIALTEKYHDLRLADRVFELAWTHSQVELRHITASEADAQTYAKLAGAVIYAGPMYRSESLILMRNRQTQSGLWGHGISGDLPIVLVRIRDRAKLELIQQVFQAHAYWRMKGLVVDIIIWNEDDSVYRQELHETIMGLIAASPEAVFVDRPGGVFLRRGEQIPEADRVLLLAVARVVLLDDAGSLREQVERREVTVAPPPSFRPTGRRATLTVLPESPTYDLKFFNDFGGFTQDGREYIILLRPGQNTPAPWVNVIANAHFGTVVSESGSVYTWAENAHEYRMTPWGNDPVGAQSGEAFYMRDEETGRFWSPTAQPARGTNTYVVRHGFGYSIYEYSEDGIASELTIYVSMDSLVKYARLRVMNRSGRARLLSATGYWELVLGELRNKTRMHIGTEVDAETNAIFARNAYNTEFVGRIVFVDTSESNRTLTCDRTEFLGRNGSMSEPAALRRIRLSGRVGAGFDACAAVQVPIQLADGDEKIVVFTFGSAESEEEARQLVYRTRGVAHAQRALDESWQYWGRTLGVVHVETPDSALDILTNGWLTYQTLACRMWARSGFYQSGGAFGFRDQLQDAMALLHAEPRLLREQILRAAARQFREGDVQHWWHPQSGRGVRSRCSDDYLWLPAATCRYVRGTGDIGILDESAGLLESRPVHPEEEGYFDLPRVTEESITIYEHCVLALKYGLRFGAHGLPLMGTGDWNDGMNQVGAGGTGESVWLAFFLYDGLNKFIELAEHKGDALFAAECRVNADILRLRIEESSWDGSWYLRAFFDDGTPLGSASNEECQIDSIPQSWSVLSGAGEPGRAKVAMENAYQRLVDHDAQLIQLFDPPFDQSELNPGYIKGYGPGIRENGGQYTHAAVWVAMAFAGLGDSERLSELVALLNPINHSKSLNAAKRYRVEPYVIAADVYATAPHTGRGGWTWYTGSAGWMYRSITESLLGLNLEVDVLRLKPCIPASWPSYKIHYRYRETFYHITVNNGGKGNEVRELFADGVEQPELFLRLVDDRADHQITISLG